MTWPVISEAEALRFLLILARAGAFVAVFPVLGDGAVPMRIKAGIAGAFSLLLAGGGAAFANLPEHWLGLVLLMGREVLIGLILGSAVRFVFMGAQFAGQSIGVQMGLGAASLFDPSTDVSVMVNGRFYYLLAVLLFLSLNLHHAFLENFGRSFQILPLGEGGLPMGGIEQWVRLSGSVLLLAVRLSLPVIAALLLLDIALGFMARLVPQMNIFLMGFPLKIALGFAVLALSVGPAGRLLAESCRRMVGDFQTLMSWMR